jgi:hypothetical protein
MTVRSFDTAEQLFEALAEDKKAADAKVEDWQLKVTPGAYAWADIADYDLTIYYEIIKLELEEGDEPLPAGYRWTRGYSQACPKGELGSVHVSMLGGTISKEIFEAARELKWPRVIFRQ